MAIFCSTSAHSQAANTSSQAAASTSDEASTLGEVIVTAQKRAESMQNVPISLAVVTATTLQQTQITTFDQLAPKLSNFTFAKTPAANLIIMRGVGAGAGSASLEQSIVLFVDGVYAGNTKQFMAPFLDVSRVEVLRGPQGALVGKNTSAGAINVVSQHPTFEFGGYVNADYNLSFGGPSIDGVVNIPITPNLAIRAVGRFSNVDGYIHNITQNTDVPKRRDVVGRISLAYDNGPLNIYTKYEHDDVKIDGISTQGVSALKNRPLDYTKESTTDGGGPDHDDVRSDGAVVEVSNKIGDLTLTSISGYSGFSSNQHLDSDITEFLGSISDWRQRQKQYSQELRLLSPTGGKFEWALGALYQHADLDEGRTTGVLINLPTSSYREMNQRGRDISVYAQAAINFSEAWRLQASLRYTDQHKSARYRSFVGPSVFSSFDYGGKVIGTKTADFSGVVSEHPVDPSATLQYHATSNVMLYATYQHGSKAGGFQGAIPNAQLRAWTINGETSISYETGAKIRLPSVGYVNIAAYHSSYKDLQVSNALPAVGASPSAFFTGNAGTAKVYGVELETSLLLGGGFELQGNAAWTPSAKYGSYTNASCFFGKVPNGSLPNTCDVTGFRLAFTPKVTSNLTLQKTTDLSDDLRLRTSLSGRYASASGKDTALDPRIAQSAFAKLDARISLSRPDDRWELALIGRNLTDKKTLEYGAAAGLITVVFSPDAINELVAPPREFVLSARVQF